MKSNSTCIKLSHSVNKHLEQNRPIFMTEPPEFQTEPQIVDAVPVEKLQSQAAADPTQVAGILGIVFCGLSIAGPMLTFFSNYSTENVESPPPYKSLFFLAPFLAISLVGLSGSIALIKKQNINLVRVAAIGMVIPLLGPLCGLTLPLGIWILVLLKRDDIKNAFRVSEFQHVEQLDDVDEFLATAAKRDRAGDWDAALDIYTQAAKRWPEQKEYIDNCVQDIKKKLSSSEQ